MNQNFKPKGPNKFTGNGNQQKSKVQINKTSENANEERSSNSKQDSNEFMKSNLESVEAKAEATSFDTGFTPKPKTKFSLGTNFDILVNNFKLNLRKNLKIYQYDVSIKNEKNKESLSNKLGKSMLISLLKACPIYKDKIIYDFKKSLYCIEKLELSQFDFENMKGHKFKAIFQVVENSTGINLNENQSNADIEQIKVLQMILTQNLRSSENYLNFGKNFFPLEKKPNDIGFYLDEREGVSISVRPSEQGINVNINKTSVAMNAENYNLLDVLREFFNCEEKILPKILANQRNRNDLFNWLKEVELVDHLGNNFFVKDILGQNANEFTFLLKNEKKTVAQYFKEKHNITLKYPNLPLLSISSRNKLPIEVCYTKLSRRENLNKDEQSKMIRNANIKCLDRKQKILQLVNELNLNEDPYLKQFGINMDLKMTELKAKKVRGAKIEYGKKTEVETFNKGRWDNVGKMFYEPKSISKWTLINFSDLDANYRDKFVESFIKNAKIHSLTIDKPNQKFDCKNRTEILNFIRDKLKEFPVDFLMVINQNNDPLIYNALKIIGDVENGIITQCVDKSVIMKIDRRTKNVQFNPMIDQLCSNICLKVNAKLGGVNFKLSNQDQNYEKYLKHILDSDCMIFGVDVNHPTPVKQEKVIQDKASNEEKSNEQKSNENKEYESVAAVVGNIDKNFCIYPARILRQIKKGKSGLETVYHLSVPVLNLLQKYKKNNNGNWPKKIIFFRDGISEGQFKPVSEHELKEIRKACKEAGPDCNPKISYIIVQKRHQTRMFPVNPKDQASATNQNVPPGTIVDTVIVTPDKFDYYICSHLGIQGTSKPCHYYMLYDENEFDSNKLILLSFYLCHIYARSTTSVSYPAPTYYADLCAERGRIYPKNERQKPIKDDDYETTLIEIHQNLDEKMFYI